MEPTLTVSLALGSVALIAALIALAAAVAARRTTGASEAHIARLANLDPELVAARLERIIGEYAAGMGEAREALELERQRIQAYYARMSKLQQDIEGPRREPEPDIEPAEEQLPMGDLDPKGEAIAEASRLGII